MTEENAEKKADEILKKFAFDMVKIYDEEAKKNGRSTGLRRITI